MFAPVRQLRLTKRNIGGAHEDNATADPGPNVWNFAKHEETQGAGPEQAEEIQRQQCRRISAFKSAGKAQMAERAETSDQRHPSKLLEAWRLPNI